MQRFIPRFPSWPRVLAAGYTLTILTVIYTLRVGNPANNLLAALAVIMTVGTTVLVLAGRRLTRPT